MKTFILLALTCFTLSASAEGRNLCTIETANKYLPQVEKHSDYDKNRHCAISCIMAVKCNDNETLLAGFMKEVKDVFGPGNAEWADYRADKAGINLVKSGRARRVSECFTQCDSLYHH